MNINLQITPMELYSIAPKDCKKLLSIDPNNNNIHVHELNK